MSGGDGKGHNSGAHATGGVNGTSGKGGPSSGGGYHYNPGKGPASSTGPDGQTHINITGGMEKDRPGEHKGNGGGGGSGNSGSKQGQWTGTGPVDIALVNKTINDAWDNKKYQYRSPEEVIGGTSYREMRKVFDSMSIDKQTEAVRQITDAWNHAYQRVPGGEGKGRSAKEPKKAMARLSERISDDIQSALERNKATSVMDGSKKNVNIASELINETVNNINNINKKISEKQKEQAPLKNELTKLQEVINNPQKYSRAKRRDAAAWKETVQKWFDWIENDIVAYRKHLAELEGRKRQAEQNKAAAEAKKKEDDALKDSISAVNDFYKELTSKYGEKLAKEARALADEAKGKTLRNSKEAIKAFDKYKDVLNKKFSVADREAIAKALESLNKEQMAKQLKHFERAFGSVSKGISWGSFGIGLAKGFRTGDWSDAIISGESIIAGRIASALVTVAFSMMAVNPVGILGFAVIMAVTSALITDKRLKDLNDFIISL